MSNINPYITTVSGRRIHLTQPDPATICINDIAHALGFIPRFGGHTPLFYSVAQHSVLVSRNVPVDLALLALLHDAAEFATGDIVSPLKQLLAAHFRPIEDAIQSAIHLAMGLPATLDEQAKRIIKTADLRALATEKRDLLWVDDGHWAMLDGYPPFDEQLVTYSNPPTAIALFMDRFRELTSA